MTHSIVIDADREKVWKTLWEDETYRKWTAAFMEGSHAVSDWNEGSKILFKGPDNNGMVSMIAEKIEPELMTFRHLGVLKDGVEDTTSEEVKAWAGSREKYVLKDQDGHTHLEVVMDISPEYEQMFDEIWPKALLRVKELSEK
ncbi:SRPBCC domain-containing protein [Robertkochia solimangrovi]|nr:SRPBCC domain-containing protein [Robertkochia solimangrovi]